MVCELFAPALASLTIERFLIVPFGVGFVCLAFCFPILGIIPETHATAAGHAGPTHGRQRRRPSKDQDETGPLLLPPPPAGPEAPPAPPAPPGPGLGLLAVLRDRNILLALFVLFAGALRQGTVSVLLQYAAVRFGWPASRTAVLVSAIAASNIVLFLAVLPQAVALLTSRWRVPPQVIDYHVVSASLAVLAVGAVCMGLASSVAGLVLCESRERVPARLPACLPFPPPPPPDENAPVNEPQKSCPVLRHRLRNARRRPVAHHGVDG